MNHKIYSKNLGMRGILSESWRLFKNNFWIIFVIILIVYIPINTFLTFISVDQFLDQGLKGIRLFVRIIQLVEFLVGIIATMAVAYLVKTCADGKKINAFAALKEALFKWPAAILTSFVTGISLLFLYLLLIVPGVIFSVYWMFVLYAVILKDEMAFDAMAYSKSVVKGRWWKTLGYAFVFGILGLLVSLLLGLFLGGVLYFLPEGAIGTTAVDILLTTATDFIAAYFTVVAVVFFLNWDATKKK